MLAKKRVLVVEDDEDIREGLRDILAERYDVTLAADGIEGLKEALRSTPDIILLDILMPRLDGFQTCEVLRQEKSTTTVPIIMVTALKDTQERIRAFETGADDYISKPFDHQELMIRISSKLKRFEEVRQMDPPPQGSAIICGNLLMDPESHESSVGGRPVKLSLLEFRLLRHLVDNRSRLCSRESILKAVWGGDDHSVRILDSHIMALRKKLEGFDHSILSVYGGGYVLRPSGAIPSHRSKA